MELKQKTPLPQCLNPVNDDSRVKVSVIIPSYNSESTIQKCLDSILTQDFSETFEIIVADSSMDGTADIIRGNYPSVLCHRFTKKTDSGTARNEGIDRAQGDVLVFIDSDCIAQPGWLRRMVSSQREMPYDVVGGSIENANPESILSLASYMVEFSDFFPKMPKGLFPHLPTCNISYKRRIFEKYGGFDSRYYPQEDYYFHWRLRKAGEKIYFDPDIRVAHHHRNNWRSFLSHQRRIGEITSRVLKVTDLPGSGFVGRPMLAAMIIPVLPLIKFTRTVYRCFVYEPGILSHRPLTILVLFVGLLIWTFGFARGVYGPKEGGKKPRIEHSA